MKHYVAIIRFFLTAILLTILSPLHAEDTPADKTAQTTQVNVCIVSGEHLQPGDIVTYVHKEEGKSDRAIRFCCRKCLARFKANPETYLKKLDQLESGKKETENGQTNP